MSDVQSTPVHQDLSIHDAVDRRLGMLDPSEELPPSELEQAIDESQASREEATTEDTPEVEAEAPEAEEETEDKEDEEQEAPVSEDEDSEAEVEAQAEDVEEEPDPEEVVYQITIDGELKEATLEDLKRGMMFQSDYTRKTQDIAKEREEVGTQKEHLNQSINSAAAIMEMALQVTGDELAKFNETNWENLQAEDPHEFAMQYQNYQFAVQKRQEIEQRAGQLVQAQQQMSYESTQARIQSEQAALIQILPDMADVKKGPELQAAIRSYAIDTLGLSQHEMDNIIDHRVVIALNKARLYDELNGKVKSVGAKKRSKAPRKTVKAGSPISKSQVESEHVTKLRNKASKTGSVDDAVEALLAKSSVL